MRKDKIIYQLSVEDVQTVAEAMMERKLNNKELKKVIDKLGDNIPWFDSIQNTFLTLGLKSKDKLMRNL